MSEPADSDPERLLAEALRAQARSAPAQPRPPHPVQSGAQSSAHSSAQSQPPPAIAGEQTDVIGTPGGPRQPDEGLPHGYGLLSGTGASSLERERAALDPLPDSTGPTQGTEPATAEHGIAGHRTTSPRLAPLAARWVLLLAVVLGLAAGSVIGLLTLL